MKRHKLLTLGLIVALSTAGCSSATGQASAETTEVTESAEAAVEEAENTINETSEVSEGGMPEGELPELPEGEMPDGERPELPEGEMADGERPTPPDGEFTGGPEGMQGGPGGGQGGPGEGQGGPGGGQGGPGGQSSTPESYDAVTEYSEDGEYTSIDLESTGTDENAILVSGGNVTLSDVTINRTSSDSTGGDSSSFYGVGAAVLATDGTLTLKDAEITTDSKGGAGVFAYGDGVVYVSDTTIYTEKSTSGGIHVAGGGTLYAANVTAETNGESSAAVRSDRGGGTMVVDGGSYTSNGTGSPAVYSTADITIHDAELTATGSEAVCIEGLNSLSLYDCDLSGNMSDNEQNDCTWNIILYQSMSGDSEIGNSTFTMVDGTLTAHNGGMFYTTNTESTFILENVDITYAEENDFFLKVTGNSNARGWGSAGANGADCLFTAIDQEMEGDILWDSISNLDFYMTEGSTLTGAILDDESNAGDGGDGYCAVYVDKTSKWIVTEDSVLTDLQCEGQIVDSNGNTVTIIGTDGTVYVEGNSNITVTVDSYSDTCDVSGASTPEGWNA